MLMKRGHRRLQHGFEMMVQKLDEELSLQETVLPCEWTEGLVLQGHAPPQVNLPARPAKPSCSEQQEAPKNYAAAAVFEKPIFSCPNRLQCDKAWLKHSADHGTASKESTGGPQAYQCSE